MSKPRFGPVDFNTRTMWIRNYRSTAACNDCAMALAYNARVLYQGLRRCILCEPCGDKLVSEIVTKRREQSARLAPVIERRRSEYDRRNLISQNPNILTTELKRGD